MILHVRGLEPLLEVQAQHRSSCASCIGATQRSSGENKNIHMEDDGSNIFKS